MQVLTVEEANSWCLRAGLVWDEKEQPAYPGTANHELFIAAPTDFRAIHALAYCLSTFRGRDAFYGGMLWLAKWDIGYMERVGWRIVEGNRRSVGDLRSIESAPAQFFREDELFELQAYLVQVIGFGWIADFVPAMAGWLIHFKANGQIRIRAEDEKVLAELRGYVADWNPRDNDLMVEELRRREATRGETSQL